MNQEVEGQDVAADSTPEGQEPAETQTDDAQAGEVEAATPEGDTEAPAETEQAEPEGQPAE